MKIQLSFLLVFTFLMMLTGCVETPESLVRDGNNEMMMKNYDEAINLYKKAIEKDDTNIEAHFQIARALYFKGQRIKACEQFAKVKKLDEGGEYARKSQVMLEKIWAELRKEGKLK